MRSHVPAQIGTGRSWIKSNFSTEHDDGGGSADVNPLGEYDSVHGRDAAGQRAGPDIARRHQSSVNTKSDTDQSDAKDEDVVVDNETEDESKEEEEIIEDIADNNDQDVGEVTFDMTEDQLKKIAEDDWETYDEDHCADVVWSGTGDESIQDPEHPDHAAAMRTRQLQRQAKDPRMSVPTLQQIQDEMKRSNPISRTKFCT
ncbi:hypothetical protein BBJ28_00014828 [Nothophytophthora sp. Chile5]|nr:hypothetical protein BBJ28_00014828 [Nothophytophthora sp. Chile5]